MPKKVIIIGGVAAGATAAARLRRMDETLEIIILERGEFVSYASCGLPYFIGDIISGRNKLLIQTPESFHDRYNVEVRIRNEVQKILPAAKQVEVKDLLSEKVYTENYDFLMICTGGTPNVPSIPGIQKDHIFVLKTIPQSSLIKQYIEDERPRRAVVIGGGFVGLEMVEILDFSGLETVLIESSDQVMKTLDYEMAAIIEEHLKMHGIKMYLSSRVAKITGNNGVEAVILHDGTRIDTDMVIVCTGEKPEVKLAREAGLEIGPTGGIKVDQFMRTSDPSIYAAGDDIQAKNIITGDDCLSPMASPANRQGWLAANNIAGQSIKYTGVLGTSIVKITNLTTALTGRNEKDLKRLGIKYETCHLFPPAHATFYPKSSEMAVKLIFTPDQGKILGAQITGYEGVDKRIDVLSTAIKAGMTVFDLQELELSYAPPFSSAKDPVNMAGYVAGDIVNHDVEIIHWPEVAPYLREGAFLLDVRTPHEIKDGIVDGAHHIPLDELRQKIETIPRDKEILIYSRTGLRSNIACRILTQNGFRVKNIDGGFKLFGFYKLGQQSEE